ncbi:type II toxin-antitoxin system Phd/YefM family antitoxin [Salinarimonas chemoclinalis]|uniref:type II toxin-antitoxin system Phd/YefM family antitoxin n=1 Tax=Salinarimonas chemoclinalis TaxID=3241599 RepID=UPI003555E66B
MSQRVAAADLQKNFGYWRDKAMSEPVQITEDDRETAYLVSAETFRELWACYRRSMSVSELSDAELAMILAADVPDEHAYEVEDLEASGPGVTRARPDRGG